MQAMFLANWKRKALPADVVDDVTVLRQGFPSLFTTSADALSRRISTNEIGRFISIIRKSSVALSVLLLGRPSPAALTHYCQGMRLLVLMRCPGITVEDLCFDELATVMQGMLSERRLHHPYLEPLETALFPLETPYALFRACQFNRDITERFFNAMLAAHLRMFRERLTFRQYFEVSRGFKHEEFSPMPILRFPRSDVEILPRFEETELRPTGERIPLADFCELAEHVAQEATCSICIMDVVTENVEEKKAVVTKCKHVFHQTCLDAWVNESCMNASNSCPSCRTELCRARERTYASDMVEDEDPIRADNIEDWYRIVYSDDNGDDSIMSAGISAGLLG